MINDLTYNDPLDVRDVEVEVIEDIEDGNGCGVPENEVYRVPLRTLATIAIITAAIIGCLTIYKIMLTNAYTRDNKEIAGTHLLE